MRGEEDRKWQVLAQGQQRISLPCGTAFGLWLPLMRIRIGPVRRISPLAGLLLLAASVVGQDVGAVGQPIEILSPAGLRIWSFNGPIRERFLLTAMLGFGARDEVGFERGIAQVLQHVLLGSTTVASRQSYDKALLACGGTVRARTLHECTLFQIEVPAAQWQLAVDWLADHLLRPAFRFDEVITARQEVYEEVSRREVQAGQVTYEKMIYPGHALGRPVFGDRTGGIESDMLRRFFERWCRLGNLAFGFAGPVAAKTCGDAIEEAFAAVPKGGSSPERDPPRGWTGRGVWEGYPNDPSGWLVTGFHLPGENLRANAIPRVLAAYADQPTESGGDRPTLLSSLAVRLHSFREGNRLEFAATVADPVQLPMALEAVDSWIALLQSPNAARFAAAKAAQRPALQVGTNDQLAEVMQICWLAGRRGETLDQFLAALDAVTATDIAAYSRELLREDRRYVVSRWPLAVRSTGWFTALLWALCVLGLDAWSGFRLSGFLLRRIAARVKRPANPLPQSVFASAPAKPIRPGNADDLIRGINDYLDKERNRPSDP